MIMLSNWHPDILEFIISKMQNPDILRYIIDNFDDEDIKRLAKDKLIFTPLTNNEQDVLATSLSYYNDLKDIMELNEDELQTIEYAERLLNDGGRWSVNDSEFLSGANISVCITDEFMAAVENDEYYHLKFPDIDNYSPEEKSYYDKEWQNCGDVREWESVHGKGVKVHKTIKAKELWRLINFCATYSAEPGVFFIDNANEQTNATAYGKKVIATNPCVTGDTLIKTVEGEKTVLELVESNKDIDVYTMDHNENLTIKKAYDFRKTQENAEVFEIKTKRGESVKVTANHPIYVRGKGWVETKDIKQGDMLVVLQTKKNNEHYLSVKLSSEKKYRLEHRFIAGYYEDIEGMDVHHEDENYRHNFKSNLKVMSHAAHSVVTNKGKPCKADRCSITGKFLFKENKTKKFNIPFDNGLDNPYACPIVDSVKYVGREDVYNFEVEDTHNYIANKIVVHNCGEQPLTEFAVCNLLAINLSNMVNKENKTIDYKKLSRVIKTGVRMGDNVIDATPYFLEENERMAKGERRIGLGVMGLADMLIHLEVPYGSKESNRLLDELFHYISVEAYSASIDLAKEKGSFPLLDNPIWVGPENNNRHAFIHTGFMKKMPEQIRKGVLEYGIRNSHLLTVAPTGSTGTFAGCSTGLEPYFSFSYYRSGRLGKFIEVKADIVKEYLESHPEADSNNLPEWFVSAMELPPEAHADTQCVIQKWIDSSISKTVNAPRGYTVDQVEQVYMRLYEGGAKGGTVYVDGSRDAQVLSLSKDDDNNKQDKKVILVDDVKPLTDTNVNYGNELGDTCPICREGKVIDQGGCHTCSNPACGAQLKCGL